MNKKVIIGLVSGLLSTALATTIGLVCHKHLKNKTAGQVATEE